MNLLLQRAAQTEVCSTGNLVLPTNGVQLRTLELPWIPDPAFKAGKPDVSCVPPGMYDLVLHDTLKHPKSFALVNPDLGVIHEPDPSYPTARFACLIHVANEVQDLEGCIGIGLTSTGPCSIGASRTALEIFQRQVPWVLGHTLEIREPLAYSAPVFQGAAAP